MLPARTLGSKLLLGIAPMYHHIINQRIAEQKHIALGHKMRPGNLNRIDTSEIFGIITPYGKPVWIANSLHRAVVI